MPTLPVIARRTRTVTVGDHDLTVRGLSRAEARHLTSAFKDGTETGDVDGAEVWMLVTVLGVTDAEAKAWREDTDADEVGKVIDAIIDLSGLIGNGPDPKPSTNGASSQGS